MDVPKVYIVILNWNRYEDTSECLASLSKLVIKNYSLNVTVVDNGSTDGSVAKLKKNKKLNFNINFIETGKNLGYAAGNNVGIKYALENGADYVFILNNDTTVSPNIIEEFIKASNKYKNALVFTPKIYFAKGFEFRKIYKKMDLGKVIWSAGGSIDWGNVYATNTHVDEVDKGQFQGSKITDFASGAGMFIMAKAFKQYGLFDERYYMYLEDVDFCERVKRNGGKILYVGAAVMWHKVAQSSAVGSDLNDYYITRNRLLFGMYAPIRSKLALYRESLRFLMYGRPWQKRGVVDFYTANFGVGSRPS